MCYKKGYKMHYTKLDFAIMLLIIFFIISGSFGIVGLLKYKETQVYNKSIVFYSKCSLNLQNESVGYCNIFNK